MPNQAEPVMSACVLRVGVCEDSCVSALHVPSSHHHLLLASLEEDIRQRKPRWFPGEGRADSISHHALHPQRKRSRGAVEETARPPEQAQESNRLDLEQVEQVQDFE